MSLHSVRSGVALLGSAPKRIEAVRGMAFALGVSAAYVLVARTFFDTPTTPVEAGSLWAALASVWLARTENIWCMPTGIVAVILLGWHLFTIDLVAQAWLQYLYYVPIQAGGWWVWAYGGEGRTELPVTRLDAAGWTVVILGALALWGAGWWLFGAVYDAPAFLAWDTSIVAASVTAQTLMTFKKRESWWFWTLPVNVSAIGLFIATEAWAFTFMYVLFLANSAWAWAEWNRSARMHVAASRSG